MPNFIVLTLNASRYSNDVKRENIWVNPSHVVMVCADGAGTGSFVQATGDSWSVEEPVDVVMGLLLGDTPTTASVTSAAKEEEK